MIKHTKDKTLNPIPGQGLMIDQSLCQDLLLRSNLSRSDIKVCSVKAYSQRLIYHYGQGLLSRSIIKVWSILVCYIVAHFTHTII
jgi:hypothetical protein